MKLIGINCKAQFLVAAGPIESKNREKSTAGSCPHCHSKSIKQNGKKI